MGYPQSSSILHWNFPYKPSFASLGYPHFPSWNPPYWNHLLWVSTYLTEIPSPRTFCSRAGVAIWQSCQAAKTGDSVTNMGLDCSMRVSINGGYLNMLGLWKIPWIGWWLGVPLWRNGNHHILLYFHQAIDPIVRSMISRYIYIYIYILNIKTGD